MSAPSRPVWPPTPGFYLIRIVKNGPQVGASITHDETGWSAMIDGVHSGPVADPVLLEDIEKIHTYGKFTTEAEVRFRLGLKRYDEVYRPNSPAANPRRAINPDVLIPF